MEPLRVCRVLGSECRQLLSIAFRGPKTPPSLRRRSDRIEYTLGSAARRTAGSSETLTNPCTRVRMAFVSIVWYVRCVVRALFESLTPRGVTMKSFCETVFHARHICLMWDGWVVSNPNRRAGVRTVFVSSAHGTVVSALALCVGCESFEPRGGARCDL